MLFTYGDKGHTRRPTVGMMINNPTQKWTKGKVVAIYDSGADDQGNPSSVEISPGSFLTLGYNAKAKRVSRQGGSLWARVTKVSEYR